MHTATVKLSRTAPYTKPVHTETFTAGLPATGYARLPIVSACTGVAKSTIWAWARAGRFPTPVKLSSRVTAWNVSDVRAWLADPTGWQAANEEGK